MRNQIKTYRLLSLFVLLAVAMLSTLQASAQRQPPIRILIYTKAAGFQHASIPVAEAAILKLAAQNHFGADMSGDPADFNDENLKKYKAVIFVSTTGNCIPGEDQR